MLLKMLHEDAQNNPPQVSSESGDRILRQGGGGAVSDDLMRAGVCCVEPDTAC